MNLRIIKNDILRSRLITLGTTFFVAVAAMLVVLAAVLIVNLSGSIDHLMTAAKSPHFLQMHSGEYDAARLDAFAFENANVEDHQVLEFLNVEGSQIFIGENSLQASILDNGFSVQSQRFDFLLDTDNRPIQPVDGEVYLPISLLKDGTAKVGDTVRVGSNSFTVAGFLRDSQMNSTLASSQRFLVSETDYATLRNIGSVEYLIEFRLHDLSQIGAFETAYANADIANNGPALTYAQFQVVNALSDGLMIAVILLVSVLVVAIAFLCIRFTLLAKIEDDYREIGVMKAVGMRVADIKKIYLGKYTLIAAAGSLLGFALSYLFRGPLLENIRLYMGDSGNGTLSLVFGIIGVVLVFLVIVLYVNRVLGRFKKISAADAVRFGMAQEKAAKVKSSGLAKGRVSSVNAWLGVRDVLVGKRLYLTLLVVLVLCVFIFLLPLNLHHTISSTNFVRYMGIGQTDMLIGIQQTDDVDGKAANVAEALSADADVDTYTVLTTKTFTVQKSDGTVENIRVELGDHSIFPVEYSSGAAPAAESEIALSAMNADELELQVGDSLNLMTSMGERILTVCGVYSDITNGGKTAKATFTDDGAGIMWSSIYVLFDDASLTDAKVAEYAGLFPYAKVADIAEYMDQTFGTTVESVGLTAVVACLLAPAIAFFITLLFMRMMVTKEHYPIAVMKAIGFTTGDIRRQFLARGVLVLALGLVAGMLLAATLGEGLAGMLISFLGVTSFQMEPSSWATWLACPLVMAAVTLLAVMLASAQVGNIKISENIKDA